MPFPATIPALTNPLAGDPTTAPSHADQHSDANDAIEEIATRVNGVVRNDVVMRFRGYGPTEPATDLVAGDVFLKEV